MSKFISNLLYSLKSENAKRREMEKAFASVDASSQDDPNQFTQNDWHNRPLGVIALGIIASLLAWAVLHHYGLA
jgi:hypothetical protein